MNIPQTLLNEILMDDADHERESVRLVDWFAGLGDKEREAVNLAFTYICGWTLETLMKKAGDN